MVHALGLESAQSITAKPLSGRVGLRDVHDVKHGNVSQEVTDEQKESTNNAETLDDQITITVLLRLGKTAVDDMAEIGLHADMEESSKSQHTVDPSITSGII
jgi:hypothetical protein